MDFINLRSVFNRKISAKNPLLFIYKTVVGDCPRDMLLRHEIIHPRQKSPQSTERWHNQEPDDHQPISRLPQHSITDNAHRVKMPNKQTSHLGKTIPVSAPPTTVHKANVAFSKALCVAARIQNYCLPLEATKLFHQ